MTHEMVTPIGGANRRPLRILLRILIFLLIAWGIGSVLSRTATKLNESPAPSGFVRGMLHGALMPLALPNLLVGRDVPIYAEHNTGRTYKLGYTVGVNGCGLLFFGFFFWRISQWRRAVIRRVPEG